MIDVIVGLKTDLEMLKTAFGNALKVGPVAEIDAKRGYRLKLGNGPSGPYLSPWYPHPESGGQTASWMPLSKGQIVAVVHPAGDMRQGVMFRAGFGGNNAAPSADLAANVLRAFGVTITMKDGRVTLEGDLTVKGDVEVHGHTDFHDGHVRHNGTAIDDTHRHGGVDPGNGITNVPV